MVTRNGKTEAVVIHPNFRLFATMNPEHYQARELLSEAFLGRFIVHEVTIPRDQLEGELAEIVSAKLHLSEILARQMVQIHFGVVDASKAWTGQAVQKEPYAFNLRHLLRFGRRIVEAIEQARPSSLPVGRQFTPLFKVKEEGGSSKVEGKTSSSFNLRPSTFELPSLSFDLRPSTFDLRSIVAGTHREGLPPDAAHNGKAGSRISAAWLLERQHPAPDA